MSKKRTWEPVGINTKVDAAVELRKAVEAAWRERPEGHTATRKEFAYAFGRGHLALTASMELRMAWLAVSTKWVEESDDGQKVA